MHGQAYIR